MYGGFKLVDPAKEFITDPDHALETYAEFNGIIVGIVGKQGTGKSTLLNRVFDTHFRQLDRSRGLQSTTHGIDASIDDSGSVLVLDTQGIDAVDLATGPEALHFQAKLTALVLSLADVVIFNIPDATLNHVDAFSPDIWQSAIVYHLAQSSHYTPKILVAIRDFPPDADERDAKAAVARNLNFISERRGLRDLLSSLESQRRSDSENSGVSEDTFTQTRPVLKLTHSALTSPLVDSVSGGDDGDKIDEVESSVMISAASTTHSGTGVEEYGDDLTPTTPVTHVHLPHEREHRSLSPPISGWDRASVALSAFPSPLYTASASTLLAKKHDSHAITRLIEDIDVIGIPNLLYCYRDATERAEEFERIKKIVVSSRRRDWAFGELAERARTLWDRINVDLRLVYLDTSDWGPYLLTMLEPRRAQLLSWPSAEDAKVQAWTESFFSLSLEALLGQQLWRVITPSTCREDDPLMREIVKMVHERTESYVQEFWYKALEEWLIGFLYRDHEEGHNVMSVVKPPFSLAQGVWLSLQQRASFFTWRNCVFHSPDIDPLVEEIGIALQSALEYQTQIERKRIELKSRAAGGVVGAIFGPIGIVVGATMGSDEKVQTFVRNCVGSSPPETPVINFSELVETWRKDQEHRVSCAATLATEPVRGSRQESRISSHV
eukprot:Blabericola_migrator_1__6263@NODE_315_length_10009_cov_152_710823_g255_i1_p3_GENE_NODE_315_length_10009_cov_152_710823_g255_i1NODE_315_length_10009_cov_152_710823_g255_i1_p3_ORF_typecomplete_len664_score77_64RHD3/PF05879_12/4_8e21GBP/PF02263_19/9_6e12MMR_HSR1/PF01926_23/1_7e06RsgA_GTPase/PF03193_16/0_00037AIG1/PF04548_16/0_0081AAA_16/PF13191_6/0_026AAA_22/PF13401_6/0_022MnmE_helical/PF12631_7/0_012ABC_tran/PF00005_27/0_021NBARC/PF00931_22/0_027AAA_29/PF13555_6/0_029KAP_NTPase/PF07693_14/0_021Tni